MRTDTGQLAIHKTQCLKRIFKHALNCVICARLLATKQCMMPHDELRHDSAGENTHGLTRCDCTTIIMGATTQENMSRTTEWMWLAMKWVDAYDFLHFIITDARSHP
jgi:hypothetical protein